MKKVIFSTLLVVSLGLFLASCSKDDGPSTPTVATPTITNFSPTSGPVGTVVTINGTNFSTTASSNTVKIGAASAIVNTATATRLTITIPQSATTGAISVSVGGKTASGSTFTVQAPITLSLDKTSVELFTNDTDVIVPTLSGANLADIVWSSSNESVVTVDNQGNITAIAAGSAEITASLGSVSAASTITVNPNVYVLGRSGVENHVVWKNGTEQFLFDAGDIEVPNSLSVDENGLIYVLDAEVVNRVPEVWTIDPTNGSVTQLGALTDAMQDDYSNVRMHVENGVVYVAASGFSGGQFNVLLWINGQLSIPVAFGNLNASFLDFFVRDGVFHVLARDEDSGEYMQLAGEDLDVINEFGQAALTIDSFFVDEQQKTYILVDHPSLGGLYVDGVNQNLPGENSLFSDVTSEEGIAYVGGQNASSATIWVNGTATPQSVPNNAADSSVRALAVFNGQIHAVGYYHDGNRANQVYWKNNVLVEDYFNLEDNNLIVDTGLDAIAIFLR